MKQPHDSADYIVGIDLGTTNCVVTYCDLSQAQSGIDSNPPQQPNIELFEIEQLIAPGEIAALPYLPSFRYHPTVGEIRPQDALLPWQQKKDTQPLENDIREAIVGEWARELNSKVEGRGVVSAKSWLSHPSVDRQAPILPWSAAQGVAKVSPVVASASYLSHIRHAWDQRFPDSPLAQQEIILTIPASFDDAARALTLQAAKLAGLPQLLLLEEPQAVVYDWLYRHEGQAAKKLADTGLILVCDLGGGTTDLSLVSVAVDGDDIDLQRVAVGDHLILGGDNVDLAIAHQAEKQLTKDGKKLTSSALAQLIQQSRKAKELLLSSDAPDEATVTVLGSGSRLIGGARKTRVLRSDVHNMVIDGFFPLIPFDDKLQPRRTGVVEFGLNYASDPAVSRHIASFLTRHQPACRAALKLDDDSRSRQPVIPDAILFNGGVFNSPLIINRVLELFAQWSREPLSVLQNDRPDQAVAYGASAYGLARHGWQTKIEGGSARSYFLKVDNENTTESKALCVLPKGTPEGETVVLENKQFSLKLGQPVSFDLISTVSDISYTPGQLIDTNDESFVALPPLVSVLGKSTGNNHEVIVEVVATMTAIGTLQMQCVERQTQQSWGLEFQLRSADSGNGNVGTDASFNIELPENFTPAKDKISDVFGVSNKNVDKNAVKNLRPALEKLLGKKADWDTPLLRSLAQALSQGTKKRRRSNRHERLWNNLMGYCLRPGFGYPLDEWLVSELWNNYPQGVQFSDEPQSWSEWWTLWRRVAGGLDEQAQKKIYRDVAKYINPASARNPKVARELTKRSYEDIVRLVAVLELLPVESKLEAGNWLLQRLHKGKQPDATWWALGRIGSRVPFHGSAHKVIPSDEAEKWIEFLLAQDWNKNRNAASAASMIARQSGDRERDLDEAVRSTVIDKLKAAKCAASWVHMVEQVMELDAKDQQRIFGEALPAGLRLIK
jgi:molecular chaperone DnaK (HSP70)